MDIRQSVFGEIVTRSGSQVSGIDLGTLIRRLLLFENVVIRSYDLREIRPLIRAFGKSGFLQLFNSGALKISCEALYIITATARNGVPSVPPCHFTFGIAELAQREERLRKGLSCLQGIAGLGNSERQTMEGTILAGLLRPPSDYGPQLQAQIESDIRNNNPSLKAAIDMKLREKLGGLPSSLDIRVEEPQNRVFHIVTNLSQACGFSEQETHGILQSCVSSVANLNQRIADMAAYSSITGFTESEAPLLFGKFASIVAPQNPAPIEKQFGRVVSLAHFPDFPSNSRVDVEKLLRVRESPECVEFRAWLAKLGEVSDKEIAEMTGGMRSKIGSIMHSGMGKALRFATTAGAGLIPGAGIVTGLIAGALDSFLVDKLFPTSGAVAFLTHTYPSLFDHA